MINKRNTTHKFIVEAQLGKTTNTSYYCKILFTNSFFPATTYKDGTTPYLPENTGRRLRPPSLSFTIERMLRHPIYPLPLE